MKNPFIVGLLAASLVGMSAFGSYAAADDATAPAHHSRMEERAALLDARLEGLRAGLRLTADEEKNWPAFESGVRAIAKARADRFREKREAEDESQSHSLIDRLHETSNRLAQRSTELKTLADATAPLYASLDEDQRHIFGALFRDLARSGHHRDHHWDEKDR